MKKISIKKRAAALIAVISLLLPQSIPQSAAAAEGGEYDYILNTFDENAYVMFGDEIKQNNCEFFDGIAQGITDKENALYNEKSSELGMDGRKFYKDNPASVKIDESFYGEDDREFLVSVAYYDYGPSEGRIYFEYFPENSKESKRVTMIKSGAVQDWFVKTFYINDMDLKRSFEDGSNVRLITGAWNLFKKLEIVNISKLKREKAAARATLASAKRDSLIKMSILDGSDAEFLDKNLNESCNERTAHMLLNIICGRKRDSGPEDFSESKTMTQGELLELFGSSVGVKLKNDEICEHAKELGLTFDEDLLFCADAEATNYNLLALANNTLLFTREDQSSLATDLLKKGLLNEKSVCQSGEEKLIAAVFRTPQPCPYEVFLDNETGQQICSMSIYGLPTMRPYVTTQSWLADGKRLICALVSGSMFIYDTEAQTLKYVDSVVNESQRTHAMAATDDFIYYLKKADGEYSIWRADANAEGIVPELVTNAPTNAWISVPQLSNDCNYISVDYTDNAHEFSQPGDRTFARYSIKDKKWEIYVHNFSYGNVLTHNQVNPAFPDLLSFCHEIEGSGLSSPYEILDRMWIYDCNTKEAKCMYAQGVSDIDGLVLQGATHEVWSNDGQYMYFINYSVDSTRDIGLTPSAVRFNLDGSHRQYYYDDRCPSYSYQHLYATDDNKFIVADGNYVVLISTETNEHFPITHFVWSMGKSHPYQAHPVIARNRYIVSWGAADDTGILCVRWFDFSKLAKKTAKGGHYSIGGNVDRVSYAGLDCESTETNINSIKGFCAKTGKAVYLDVRRELIDSDCGAVKLSFDYLDNGTLPIIITYTSGVKSDNDRWRVFDAEKRIERKGSGAWKHAEIIIESGNFENIGRYETDIKVSGAGSNVYIANINAELADKD